MARTHEVLTNGSIEAQSHNGVIFDAGANLGQSLETPRIPTGTREAVINIIRAMYEGEVGGDVNGFAWRSDLASTIPLSLFRRTGILTDLNIQYGGDVALAVRDAFPNPIGKPLLSLDDPRPEDPLYKHWEQVEEKIADGIDRTRTFRQQINNYFFRERWAKHGGFWTRIKTGEYHQERMYYEKWLPKENLALKSTIDRLIKPGDTVCSFLSGHDAVLPSLLLGRIQHEGELYVVTPGQYLEEGFFANSLNLLLDLESVKGLNREARMDEKTDQQRKAEALVGKITGSGLINGTFRQEASEFLSHPYRYNERFYREGLDWQDTLLMQRFFEHFNIHPLRIEGPDLPREIPSRSLDTVVEADRFAVLPEEDIEAALYELDRVLKPGGYLIFREGSRQQALLEYYGQELFDQNYSRIRVPDVKSAQLVVLQKAGARETLMLGDGEDSRREIFSRQFSRKESRQIKSRYSFHWLVEEGAASISVKTASHIQQALREMEPEQLEKMRMTKLTTSDVFKWLGQVSDGDLEHGEYTEEQGTFHGWKRVPRGKQWELLLLKEENNQIMFHLRRLPEGEVNEKVNEQNDGVLSDKERLVGEVATTIAQTKDSNALSLSWFRNNGYLPILISEFGGSVERIVEAAKLEVARQEHQRKSNETPQRIKTPEKSKPFYTVQDLAKELRTPVPVLKDILESLGMKQAHNSWIIGPSHYTAEKKVPYHFSYAEYQSVREVVQGRIKSTQDNGKTKSQGTETKTDDELIVSGDASNREVIIEDEGTLPEVDIPDSDKKLARPPEGVKSNYTIDDLAQELSTSKSQVRKAIDRLGIRTQGLATGRSGQSGFTKKAVASRQLSFSYQEYVAVRDALKHQNLRPNGKRPELNQGGNNGKSRNSN